MRTVRLPALLLLGVFIAQTTGAQPPEPPKKEPTRAELIVGDWIMTMRDGRPASKNFDMVMTFTRDGVVKSFARSKDGQIDKLATGAYRVIDDTVEFSSGQAGDGKIKRVPILKLTMTELTIHLPVGDEISRVDYIRDKVK